jgi:hypothetical protein
MRDFFKHLLQNLDKLTGLQQYHKLCQTPDPREEIKTLLDILCRVTDQYKYIPDVAKQAIIQEAVIQDPEFIGLNAKFISKHLNLKKEFYMKENEDVAISPDALTGEAREQKLKEWAEALSKVETNLVSRVDIYKTVREQWQPKDGTEKYKPIDPDLAIKHQRHLDYVKSNYDPRTGKPLPEWMPEDKWLKES